MILKFYHAELISQWTICWLFRRKSLWNMADVLINIIVSLLMGNIANPSGGTYSLITYVPLQISSMYTSFLGDRSVMCYHQVLKKTSGSSWWIGTIFVAVICGSETMNPNQQQQLGWHVCFRLQRLDWMDCGDVWFRHKLGDPLNHQVRFELFLTPIEDNTSVIVMFSVDWQTLKKMLSVWCVPLCSERNDLKVQWSGLPSWIFQVGNSSSPSLPTYTQMTSQ